MYSFGVPARKVDEGDLHDLIFSQVKCSYTEFKAVSVWRVSVSTLSSSHENSKSCCAKCLLDIIPFYSRSEEEKVSSATWGYLTDFCWVFFSENFRLCYLTHTGWKLLRKNRKTLEDIGVHLYGLSGLVCFVFLPAIFTWEIRNSRDPVKSSFTLDLVGRRQYTAQPSWLVLLLILSYRLAVVDEVPCRDHDKMVLASGDY